jgi:hypothetical protein
VKQILLILMLGTMLGGAATATLAAETDSKGEVAALLGSEDIGWFNYQLNNNFQFFAEVEEDFARSGFGYQWGESFSLKAGATYDDTPLSGESEVNPFAVCNWTLPFGNNTRFMGKYAYDYDGKDWQTYEAFIRVEIFSKQYVRVGVRGDLGDGADKYDYDSDDDDDADNKEMMIFLRGDFEWEHKRFGLKLRPILYVQGIWLHDYDLTYKVNDRWNILINANSLYDKEMKYRTGVQFKF